MIRSRVALLSAIGTTLLIGSPAPALAHTQTVQPPGQNPVVQGPISKAWARAHCEAAAPGVVSEASGGVVSFVTTSPTCGAVQNPGGQLHP